MKKFSIAVLFVLVLGLIGGVGLRATVEAPRETAASHYALHPPKPRFSTAAGSAELAVAGGPTLFQYHGDAERPIASVTKIMTANVVLTHPRIYPLNRMVTITPDEVANYRNGLRKADSEVPLSAGERVTVKDLLWALMLPSADDSAWVLADNYPGGASAFIAEMNRRAQQLGMHQTHYVDPDGVNHHGYSTTRDLMKLIMRDMAIPEFRTLVSTKTAQTPFGDLTNLNQLLWSYPGAIGIKTGWTPYAGTCLAFAATRAQAGNSLTLYGVVLGEPSTSLSPMFRDVTQLLNTGFRDVPWRTVVPAGREIGVLPVKRGWLLRSESVPLLVKKPLGAFADVSQGVLQVRWYPLASTRIERGQVVGEARLETGSHGLAVWVPVVAGKSVTVRWWERL
ncbi:D-alanyl-D-alanine carboxypeptidase family protein [Sulfobacillus harzensis]|uniref:D-alanyl-D-alanine carboxypeptidase n=1 Tax=Sulfobacillus harzensis TaxID=2729629 RepID=A0A7Y0L0J3_9FIRM|nr:D-alanyl-D-alanine carboxypeptidase [Sulfobacillus harzensis]NMP21057.1 D-alanyl-D-alanine carboxypeptidase [Sulfobacillus harzensis]